MTEAELKLAARLSALEYCIGTLFAASLSAKEIKSYREIVLSNLRSQSLAIGPDPFLSDAASDEVCQNVERILKGAETLAASPRRR